MKYLIIIILLIVSSVFYLIMDNKRLESAYSFSNGLTLKDSTVYLILRGSDTKLGGYAKQYNSTNPYASHLGIMIVDKGDQNVFHVNTNQNEKGSHLISESLSSFTKSNQESYPYISFWEIKGLNSIAINRLQNYIKELDTASIKFDYQFNFENNEEMYCSEFVYKTLFSIDSLRFSVPKTRKKVLKSHQFFLKKDTLDYYPVDYFYDIEDIELIGEWKDQSSK